MLLCKCWYGEVSAFWGDFGNVIGCLQDLSLWVWLQITSSDHAVLLRTEPHAFGKVREVEHWGFHSHFLTSTYRAVIFSFPTHLFKPKQYFPMVCSAWQFWPIFPQADYRWICLLQARPSLLPFFSMSFLMLLRAALRPQDFVFQV